MKLPVVAKHFSVAHKNPGDETREINQNEKVSNFNDIPNEI